MDKWSLFFGWVGVVSLMLAIPLSMAANILTPKFQQWRALRSRDAAVKRLTILDAEMERIRLMRPDEALAATIRSGLRAIRALGFTGMSLIMLVLTNELYVAQLNGWKLDPPELPLWTFHIHAGIFTVAFLIFQTQFSNAISSALEDSESISVTGNAARSTALEAKRNAIASRFDLSPHRNH